MPSHHLVTVWNPSYATNALEAHLRVLLEWERTADAEPDEVYVWWGKVKSSQRQSAMPHLSEVLALSPADDDEREVHLYLTDYRSLYVAAVDCIQTADPRLTPAEVGHVPGYYESERLQCDCWFLLRDVRLLVRDDLEGVAAELGQLRNVRYADRPVSLYGGMVDLPLIVSRSDDRQFFDADERVLLTGQSLWALFDSEQRGVGATEATLREDHFGASAWSSLDGTARRFIAMAESTFRQQRSDPAADLSAVAVFYGKAIEVQVAMILRAAMRDASEPVRHMNRDGRSVRLPDALPLTLAPLVTALSADRDRIEHLAKVLHDGGWLATTFAAALDQFVEQARNPSSHGGSGIVSRDVVIAWRNRLLGVGCEGLLVRLAAIRRK